MTETSREGWTPEEIALYDAKSNREAWGYAHEILLPLVEVARSVGSPELERVMEKALAEVEEEANRTLDVLEALQKRGSCG